MCPACGGSNLKECAPLDLMRGRVLGDRYVVSEHLGKGGMGSVYRAKHRTLGKDVAVKILDLQLAEDPVARRRFFREARDASRLVHPHNVNVIDFGYEGDGVSYLVMDIVPGRPLRDLQFPMDVGRALRIALQVAGALQEAHNLKLVHRDLKPENVMVSPVDGRDFCTVLDYGIAKSTEQRSALTKNGAMVGTPAYCSPEQALGSPVDYRSDIYSLGVMFFEMVTGTLPFPCRNAMGFLFAHAHEKPQRPSQLRALPPGVESVILDCLEKKPVHRPASMEDVRSRVVAALSDLNERASKKPSSAPEHNSRQRRSLDAEGALTTTGPSDLPRTPDRPRQVLETMKEPLLSDEQTLRDSGGSYPGEPRLGDTLVGRYRICQELGRGDFGIVFRAVDETLLKRDVVVKVIFPAVLRDPSLRRMLEDELRFLTVLNHPSTERLFDICKGDGTADPFFLVMEYVQGRSLHSVLVEDGPLDELRTTQVAVQILQSLSEAHGHRVVHRNLTPRKVLLCEAHGAHLFVKVLGFGMGAVFSSIARKMSPAESGPILRSPRYMSPEVAAGSHDIDCRSDLYTVGLIIAECLLGRPLVSAPSPMLIMRIHSSTSPLALPGSVEESRLEGVLRVALAKNREERFPDAGAMIGALKALGELGS